jgi:hypothetical protein
VTTEVAVDPSRLALAQWEGIAGAVTYLVLFAALALAASLAFVLGYAVLPSYASTAGSPPAPSRRACRALSAVAAVALLLALWAFAQAVRLAVAVLAQHYPRFAI